MKIRNLISVPIFVMLLISQTLVSSAFSFKSISEGVQVIFSKIDSGVIIKGIDNNAVGIQLEITLSQGVFDANSYYRDDNNTSFMKVTNDKNAIIYVANETDLRIGDDIFVGLLDMSDDMVLSGDAKLTVVDFILKKDIYESIDVSVVNNPVVEQDSGTTDSNTNTGSSGSTVEPEVNEDTGFLPFFNNWLNDLKLYLSEQGNENELSIHLVSLLVAALCFIGSLVKVFRAK